MTELVFASIKELLIRLIPTYHHYGDFTLSSGKTATEYFDLAPLLLSNRGLRLVCAGISRLLEVDKIWYEAVACYELCPVPLLGAFIRVNPPHGTHNDLHGLIVRKQRKGHGTNQIVEGDHPMGERVVVFEDVTSTGASVLRAVHTLERSGSVIAAVVAIINRQEGCDEVLKDYNFKWLFTKDELDGYLRQVRGLEAKE